MCIYTYIYTYIYIYIYTYIYISNKPCGSGQMEELVLDVN